MSACFTTNCVRAYLLRSKGLQILVGLLLAVFVRQSALASGLPDLQSHSKANVSLYQGDEVELSVKAQGEDLHYRWVRNYETICRKPTCQFNSGKWGVGTQNIVVVIYNEFGSRSVRFKVKVLARPLDAEVEMVKPDMIPAENIDTLTSDDLYVIAMKGIGYVYRNREVKIIGRVPRRLIWEQKIKSHTKGRLRFGKRHHEEHIITEGSEAELLNSEEGLRIIRLLRGALRSRQLAESQPRWSISLGDWLQIDTDQNGDVIVVNQSLGGKKKAYIINLRGYARIIRKDDDSNDEMMKGKSFVLPPASFVTVYGKKDPKRYEWIRSKLARDYIAKTSPQYFLSGMKFRYRGDYISKSFPDLQKKAVEELRDLAEQAVQGNDFLLALEYLLASHDRLEDDKRVHHLLMARAYRHLGLFSTANRFYKKVIAEDVEDPQPYYEVAQMYLVARHWKKALHYLEKAQDNDFQNLQKLHYYLGVVKYNLGHRLAARNDFIYSIRHASNIEMERSAKGFLFRLDDEKFFGADGTLALGIDSNVYRLSEDVERTDDYKPVSGNYYLGYGKLYYRGYKSSQGLLEFSYDVQKRGFFDSDLKDVEQLDQTIAVDWLLLLGGDEVNKADFKIYLRPHIATKSFGEERSDDVLAMDAIFGSPSLSLSPELKLRYASHLDPLPARDDKLDPVTSEVVTASDRSGIETVFGLGIYPIDSLRSHLRWGVDYRSMVHENEFVTQDDFTEIRSDLGFRYLFFDDFQSSLGIRYFSRDYKNSDNGRKDSLIGSDLMARYYYSPNFYNDLGLDYSTQNSSEDLNTYSRYDISLSLTLKL